MKAITVRQPWAWLIIHAGKDIENRTWSTRERGRVLIHAAKCCTREEYDNALDFALGAVWDTPWMESAAMIPRLAEIQRGGIVGSVEIVDCVTQSDSPWFVGPHGFVLRDSKPISFTSYPGALGFWAAPTAGEVARHIERERAKTEAREAAKMPLFSHAGLMANPTK